RRHLEGAARPLVERHLEQRPIADPRIAVARDHVLAIGAGLPAHDDELAPALLVEAHDVLARPRLHAVHGDRALPEISEHRVIHGAILAAPENAWHASSDRRGIHVGSADTVIDSIEATVGIYLATLIVSVLSGLIPLV